MADNIDLRRRRPTIKNCIVCGASLGSESIGTDETICNYCKERPLEPCPFCGMPAKIHRRRSFRWTVCCRDTKCPGHNIGIAYNSRTEASCSWNRRYYKNPSSSVKENKE